MKRKREARYRARLRAEVRSALGNACAMRAMGGCAGKLEIDHAGLSRTWDVTSVDPRTRWRRYRNELRSGVPLRLLCKSHNGTDGNIRRHGREAGDDEF